MLTLPAALVALAAWLLLQGWGLGKTPFHTKGEPREAVVVAEMLQGGNWILARRNATELPAKPPLFHWLGAAVSSLAGRVTEWSVRLPSALLSGAAALLLFYAAARLYGLLAGTASALALLSSFEWLRAATSARVDMSLAFGLTLSFVALLLQRVAPSRVWLVLLYAGITWAILTKGPVGAALPLLQIALLCIVDRSLRFARRLRLVRGLSCSLVVAGTWYGLAWMQGGAEFLQKQILDENVYRFLGHAAATGGHRHSVAYLAGMLLLGLLPWTLLLPSLLRGLWQERRALDRNDARSFALLWAGLVFGFYALAASKRGVYLLPLYPALCLLLGWWASELIRGRLQPGPLRPIVIAFGCAFALVAGTAAVLLLGGLVDAPIVAASVAAGGGHVGPEARGVAALLQRHAPALLACLAAAAATAGTAALAAQRRVWGVTLAALFLATLAAAVAARQLVLPAIAREQTRAAFVAALRDRAGLAEQLNAYRHFDYGVVFYWGRSLPVYDRPLSSAAPPHLLLSESDWSTLSARRRSLYERIGGIESGRTGNLGRMLIARRVVPEGDGAPDAGGGNE